MHISMPIIDGMILAYLLTPLVNGIENKLLIPLLKKQNIDLNKKNKKSSKKLQMKLVNNVVEVIKLLLMV